MGLQPLVGYFVRATLGWRGVHISKAVQWCHGQRPCRFLTIQRSFMQPITQLVKRGLRAAEIWSEKMECTNVFCLILCY